MHFSKFDDKIFKKVIEVYIKDFNGYLDFHGETFPFIFKKDTLTIIPPTIEKWNEFYGEWFHRDFNNNSRNKWLDKIIIDGVTDNHKGVKFFVTDRPAYFNGYYSYKVNYLYIYDYKSETNSMHEINGIRFKGPECNYLYNVRDYINEDFEIKDNKFKKFSLELSSRRDENFGKFRWYNYSVSVNGSFSWKKDNDTYSPLEINSLIILELSRTCNDLDKLIELIYVQRTILYFCAYRKNITFKEIDTYAYTDNKLRRKIGNFYIFDGIEEESDIKHLKQILDFKEAGKCISKLYKLVLDGKIYTSHIPQNFRMKHSYFPARMLSILIAFEHTYKTLYKDVLLSNEDFDFVKKKTIEFLDNQISVNTGKIKKKFKGMKNSVSKTDLSYSEYLKYALNNNFDVLESFIKKRYRVKDAKPIITSCSERTNKIRNSMAHGNLDIDFKPINSNDIYLIELLLYSMVLKYIGLDKKIIQNKIKQLFNLYL